MELSYISTYFRGAELIALNPKQSFNRGTIITVHPF